ncbi:MAG: hypothetical protein HZC36_07640 [Armatimonadetes bacterium]|nr:hypothetical protein [Armatimonadota bacterium]
MSRIKDAAILTSAKVVAMVMQVLAIGTYVRVLGNSSFGVFDYFTVVMAYVALIELGVINAFQREVLDCMATERRREVPSVCKLVSKLLLLAALAGVPIYAAVSKWLPFGFQGVHSGDLRLFATVAWFHLAGTLALMALNALLTGASAFTRLGILTASNGLAVPGLGMVGAVVSRTPEGVLIGMASGLVFSVGLGLVLTRPFWGIPDSVPISTPEVAKRLFGVGIRAYPARLSASLAGSLDRVIIANVMPGVLTTYALCFRVAQFFQELLVPIYQMMFPPISAAVVRQEADRARTIERNILAGAALGTSCALVGGGYGLSIVRIWSGSDVLPGVAAATFWLGLCKASDLVANITGIAHFAQGRMDRLIPFFATNMTLTALLTAPMVRWFGIGGVGAMNACLSVALLIPLVFTVRNRVAPDLRVWRVLLTFFCTLACGASISLVAAWGASQMSGTWAHVGWLLTAPLAVGLCFALEIKLLRIPVPSALRRRLPRIAAWLGSNDPSVPEP